MRSVAILLALMVFPAAAAEAPSAKHDLGASVVGNLQLKNKGTVISTIDASNFTYIEVSEGGKTIWLAAMKITVKKGDVISYSDGPEMDNFHSKNLNRTFEKVIFVSKVVVGQ